MLYPQKAYKMPANIAYCGFFIHLFAQRYQPAPAKANLKQNSGAIAHGIHFDGTHKDAQKNGLPSM